MEWVLRSPQIHSTFSNLGYANSDGYHINENCNATLETILHSVLTEDKYLRSYRRNISFGQNIKKDLIPLLINAKEDKTVELLIKIFVNLTTPVECLFNLEDISKSDFGRHTLFEINNLLASTKAALTDHRATKVIVDFLKKNSEFEQKTPLSVDQCNNIINTLLFLRNILHIPDDVNSLNPTYSGPTHTIQNQILWNLFSQSIDKVLIKLMSVSVSATWGVTMVQLIALLYKDQHVTALHKLLNVWLEASLSESSEDNESNTSPPGRGSDDSSPMLTSDPTSDSSDTGGSGKCKAGSNLVNNVWPSQPARNNTTETTNPTVAPQTTAKPTEIIEKMDYSDDSKKENNAKNSKQKKTPPNNATPERPPQSQPTNNEKKTVVADNSDCGYGTQIENQESISTSSNEDELPSKKPVHQKPHTVKQRVNNKTRPNITAQERKRKKIVKRGKSNIINVQGLSHNTPTDDDISNVLKEFTVDFLLKGFNSLVKTLHTQILTNHQLKIDTSHFFWLVTYFLKFATQIELDLEHIGAVMSYDIVSYLTAEGVNICEQFELVIKLDGNDLKPSIRRLHLVVTAIREFVQAIQAYKKSVLLSNDDQQTLVELQMKMCETEELRSLLVLLLRHYNPKYHSKQYLQDLVVTNHILLIFLDSLMKLPEYKGSSTMADHIKQFATPEIMRQYGLVLEDYESNGEFINDCVFTMMHHVGGELGCLITLYQPQILRTFTSIWKSEFEVCDDWTDLVEFVINTFIKKPQTLRCPASFRLEPESFDDDKTTKPCPGRSVAQSKQEASKICVKRKTVRSKASSKQRWSEDEISSLSWKYMQCNTLPDTIGEIVKLFKEDGINKSRQSVASELLKQMLITQEEYDKHMNVAADGNSSAVRVKKETRDCEITKLCEQIAQDGKSKFLDWVQKVLLDTCSVKIYQEKKIAASLSDTPKKGVDIDGTATKQNDLPVISPVSYHSLLLNQSVPLVPWNCEQAGICKDLKFLQLLHKLGFHMPVDTEKVFIRIPHFWTPDFLYEVAAKISPIDTSKLNFSLSDISENSVLNSPHQSTFNMPMDFTKDTNLNAPVDNYYQIHKQNHLATMLNFTPMPGSSVDSIMTDDINQPTWLEMVQKSQEYNLNLNLHQSIITDDNMQSVSVTQLVTAAGMSTIMSVNQETSNYGIHHMDSEYNNSVCETASVASDLTRMYVSDEEEKPEDLMDEPLAALLGAPFLAPLARDDLLDLPFSPPFDDPMPPPFVDPMPPPFIDPMPPPFVDPMLSHFDDPMRPLPNLYYT